MTDGAELPTDKVDFVMVEDRGPINVLACPRCGKVFDIDAHSNENLVFDAAWKGMVARCPDCGALQKGDE